MPSHAPSLGRGRGLAILKKWSAGSFARANGAGEDKAVRAECAGLYAGADNFHRQVETRFLEVNDHFHCLEFRLRHRVQCGIGPLEIEGFGMFFSPLAGTGIELPGRRVAEEHFHAFECGANLRERPHFGSG